MIASSMKVYNWAKKRKDLPQGITPFDLAVTAFMVIGAVCVVTVYLLNKLGYYPD